MLGANVTEHVLQSAEQRVAGLFAFLYLIRALSVGAIHIELNYYVNAHITIFSNVHGRSFGKLTISERWD